MVFQSYALFPHMSVRENIAYGPRVRGEAVGGRVEEAGRDARPHPPISTACLAISRAGSASASPWAAR